MDALLSSASVGLKIFRRQQIFQKVLVGSRREGYKVCVPSRINRKHSALHWLEDVLGRERVVGMGCQNMKLNLGFLLVLSLCALACVAGAAQNETRNSASSAKPTILERGPNHRKVQHVSWQTNATGQLAARTNTYTELATGMHYRKNGQWQEAKEEIRILPTGGAAATKGQHQVYFPPDIYEGVIETVTADGKRLKSRPLGISYFDGSNSVLIAELTNSVGQVLPSGNQVIYTNCFTDFAADLICTYRKSGFESDLVFRGQPPGPEEFGLNPHTSRLQLLTEFFDTPEPEQIDQFINRADREAGLSDRNLKFGAMQMTRGHAFAVGKESRTSATNQAATASERAGKTRVYKSWEKLEGRTFLIEELPMRNIRSELQKLPPPSASTPKDKKSARLASAKRALPTARLASNPIEPARNLLLAQVDLYQKPGVVLDYLQINNGDGYSSEGYSMTLTGGTYLVSGPVYLDHLYVNRDVVVKYSGYGSCLYVGATHVGADYVTNQPLNVIFTSMDDDSVGQIIDGSSGSPYYATCTALVTEADTNSILNYGATFSYLYTGVEVGGEATLRWCNFKACVVAIMQGGMDATLNLWHSQIENGGVGIQNSSGYGNVVLNLRNVLFGGCDSPLNVIGTDILINAEHVTSDSSYDFFSGYGNATLNLTNCLFNHEVYGATTQNVVFDADFTGSEFQTSGDNHYYLATGSSYRDAGTSGISSNLWWQLQRLTTYAPEEISGNFGDSFMPDLGFHYPIPDIDRDGMADWWEYLHFGSLLPNPSADYDSDGVSNLDEYTAGSDPNTINFSARFENLYVSNRTVTGYCAVSNGVPQQMAVLVNSTNLGTAAWLAYNPNFTLTLPNLDGNHVVLVALRGRVANLPPVRDYTELTLDRVPPVVGITNPILASATATVLKPYLQVQGYANEALATYSYDLTNEFGLVTNQLVAVVEQFFDTNKFDFTTNYIQAFDVPLATNLNKLTLRVADLAGNVTVTNFDVVLDYTDATNAPVLALVWPLNDMQLSGDSFYLRGRINDETATVVAQQVDGNGVTNTVPGIVERNGMFWVEDLPLGAGNNEWTIIATDAAGNVSTTNLLVVKSTVVVTVTSTPGGEDLYQPYGTVSGTVSEASYSVSVNGVSATVDEWGNWTAENVPNYGQGTVTYDVAAAPPEEGESGEGGSGGGDTGGGAGPVHTSVQKEQGAIVKITKHQVGLSVTSSEYRRPSKFESIWTKGYEARMPDAKEEGKPEYKGWASDYSKNSGSGGSSWTRMKYAWSADDPIGSGNLTDSSGTDISGALLPDDPGNILAKTVPHRSLDHEDNDILYSYQYWVGHYYGKGVKHEWVYPDGEGGVVGDASVFLTARTTEKLFTGGKSGVNKKNLFTLTGGATEYYDKPQGAPWYYTPARTVPGPAMEVAGKTLGADNHAYEVLPDNTSVDVTVKVKGAKHYSAGAGATKHKSFITANGVRLASDKINVTNCVGQKIVFRLEFDPPFVPGLEEVKNAWVLPGKYVNAYEELIYLNMQFGYVFQTWTCHPRFLRSTRSPGMTEGIDNPACLRYKQDGWALHQPETGAWWVSGGKKAVSCYPELIFSNGQKVSLIEHGRFQIERPQANLGPTFFIGPVKVEPSGQTWPGALITSDEVVFEALVRSDSFSGQANWTQLVNRTTTGDGFQFFQNLLSCNTSGFELDNDLFYNTQGGSIGTPPDHTIISAGNTRVVPFGDRPGVGILSTSFISVEDSFKAYLVFNPDPSSSDNIWVTLGCVTWGWSGYAAFDPVSFTWQLISGSTNGPAYTDTDEFPAWEKVFRNSRQ